MFYKCKSCNSDTKDHAETKGSFERPPSDIVSKGK